MRYKIKTTVASLEEKSQVLSYRKTGEIDAMGKPVYEADCRNLGWFVSFAGSKESLFLGFDRPKTEVGRSATIYVEL